MAGEWTPTTPIDHTLISDLPGEDRKLKNNTIAIVEKEHRTLGDGNSGGEHVQGSAISFVLATASAPTTDPAGTAFVAADIGRLWWDTTLSQMKILTGVGPVAWTTMPAFAQAAAFLSTLSCVGDFAVNTDKFTVAAASGNTAIDGTATVGSTLDVTGATELIGVATIADASVTKTDAAPTTDAMITNMKFVVTAGDSATASGYTANDSEGNAMLKSHAYLAPLSGYVSAFDTLDASGDRIIGFLHNTNDPAGAGQIIQPTEASSSADDCSVFFFVPAGKFFEITAGGSNVPTILWCPLRGDSRPVDQD